MTGQVFDIAQEHNGYMFYTEHRYYGQSYPTEYEPALLKQNTLENIYIAETTAQKIYAIYPLIKPWKM